MAAPRLNEGWWDDPRLRAIGWQALALIVVGVGAWMLVGTLLDNLAQRSIATGFGFLARPASFAIGETAIPYSAADSYGRAVLVGVLNTLKVTVLAIVSSTLLGVVIGVARLSRNWLVAKLATVYVELVRNVPLLLQLFLWYAVITESLPGPRQALHPLPGLFLCNRGLMLPGLAEHPVWPAMAAALMLAIALGLWRGRRTAALLIPGLPLAVWLGFGAPLAFSLPELQGFNFRGGVAFSPELASLLLGLAVYGASYIAEIVRGGILAVNRGQVEAGLSLGLSRGAVLRLIVLPQALRVIVPPLAGEYHKLTKNTSLAVAIGYPDVVSVLNTMVNQTGQAIEGMALIMGVFLVISAGISSFTNWYNRRVALVER
ncbi:MAG: ABC transporter permease subunit [Rhodospirillaceae bacterium]